MVLLHKSVLFRVNNIISHTAGRYLMIQGTIENRPKQWRLNNPLIKDDTFISLIENKIKEYISINVDSVSSIQTVWEAFKATCRGWIVSHAPAKHRKAIKKKNNLQSELKTIEKQHMRDPKNPLLQKTLLTVRADLQAILHEETAFSLCRLPKKHFECGDKAGKMLALQLKQLEGKLSIPAIRDSGGNIINDPKLINREFQTFYSNLYQTECTAQDHSLDQFFKNVTLPVLNPTQKHELESSVTPNEITSAIKH
ncbi:hypothetical protein F7725_025808, partial [Dissostichus mawsoni]